MTDPNEYQEDQAAELARMRRVGGPIREITDELAAALFATREPIERARLLRDAGWPACHVGPALGFSASWWPTKAKELHEDSMPPRVDYGALATITCTEEQKTRWCALAERDGVTLSAWARHQLDRVA